MQDGDFVCDENEEFIERTIIHTANMEGDLASAFILEIFFCYSEQDEPILKILEKIIN